MIGTWGESGHGNVLHTRQTFDFSNLLASVRNALESREPGSASSEEPQPEDVDKKKCKLVVNELVHEIWQISGHRFTNRNATASKKQRSFHHLYYCCQDIARFNRSEGNGVRDVKRMERFDCKSLLQVEVFPNDGPLELTLRHEHHGPYVGKAISPEALDFVTARIDSSTPALIHQQLTASGIPGANAVQKNQIHYLWSQRQKK